MLNDILVIFLTISGAAILIWCVLQIKEALDPTRLVKAVQIGNALKIRKMLKRGAPVNGETETGTTPLIYAARAGHVHIAELLIEFGADVNHADHHGTTALMEASALGHSSIVQILLKNGATPLQEDDHGRSAVTLAETTVNPDISDLLDQEIKTA